jgi:molybdopterin converting factor small subunit
MNDLTNLNEWIQFAADKKTVLEVLTFLNNRHCETVGKLEAELAAMREEIAATDASSESELIQETQTQNITLIAQNERLLKERQAMREAIREAITAINRLTAATTEGMQYAKAKQDAIRFGIATLTKLQPYIKP